MFLQAKIGCCYICLASSIEQLMDIILYSKVQRIVLLYLYGRLIRFYNVEMSIVIYIMVCPVYLCCYWGKIGYLFIKQVMTMWWLTCQVNGMTWSLFTVMCSLLQDHLHEIKVSRNDRSVSMYFKIPFLKRTSNSPHT